MKNFLLLCCSLLFSSSLLAQWSAGVATIIPSSPYVGVDTQIKILPIVTYEGEQLTWRGPSLTYKLTGLKRGEPSFSLTLNLAPNRLDTDDSDSLNGIKDRDFSFMAGASYRQPFEFATVSLAFETDVTNKHNGQRSVVSLARPLLSGPKRQWMLNLGVELEYLSANYANYYFGVDEEEQNNSDFSQYQVGSLLQPGVSLGGFYKITGQWNVVANARWQALPNEVKDSPIVDGSSALNGFMGVIYSF
ncbi:MAG: outer membrane protein [Paraglaciecola sp.]|jgi:outer membrane protein